MRSDHRGWKGLGASRGMTLLEVMIVLAVVGILMYVLSLGLGRATKSALREQTLEVLASVRSANNLATATGAHHRVVFDLDEQEYRIERCDGVMRLRKAEEEEVADEEALAELAERPVTSEYDSEIIEADSPEEALEAAAALEGVRIGSSRCQLAEGFTGRMSGNDMVRKVKNRRGIKIRRVHVQHIEDPVEEGLVSINFFPLGSAEKAVIEVENEDDDVFSVVVHGITGRIEFKAREIEAEDHMRRNAQGDEVEEDR